MWRKSVRNMLVSVVSLLVSLCSLVAQPNSDGITPRTDSVVEYTNRGVTALNLHNDAAQAQSYLDAALHLDSMYAPAHYTLAQIAMAEDGANAVRHAKAAYEQDTTNVWYMDVYGHALLINKEYAAAQNIYEKLVDEQPRDVNSYRLLAMLYQGSNNAPKAIELLDTAQMRIGYNPYLMDMKLQLLLSTNQQQRAVNETLGLINQMPYDTDLRVALAEVYGATGNDSLAYAEYLRALKIDSMSLNTLVSLGGFMNSRAEYGDYLVVLKRLITSKEVTVEEKLALVEEMLQNPTVRQREKGQLIDLVETLAAQHPDNMEVVELQTSFYIAMGSLEGALKILKGHIAEGATEDYYYKMTIDIERYLNRRDSVMLYHRMACNIHPDDPELAESWAHSLTSYGDYEAAEEQYHRLLDMSDDSLRSKIWCMIGDMHMMAKDSRRSYKAYEKSLKFDDDNPLTLNNYAYTLSENGNRGELKRALKMSQRATELVDGSPTNLDTYGWVLYKVGEYDEAKRVLRRAIALDTGKNPEIALHYGAVLWVLGEDTMADIYWERAKEWGAKPEEIELSREEAKQRRSKVKID